MPKYAELLYNGFWYSPERLALQAAIDKTQEFVTGTVRLKLYKVCGAANRLARHPRVVHPGDVHHGRSCNRLRLHRHQVLSSPWPAQYRATSSSWAARAPTACTTSSCRRSRTTPERTTRQTPRASSSCRRCGALHPAHTHATKLCNVSCQSCCMAAVDGPKLCTVFIRDFDFVNVIVICAGCGRWASRGQRQSRGHQWVTSARAASDAADTQRSALHGAIAAVALRFKSYSAAAAAPDTFMASELQCDATCRTLAWTAT
jgi:Arginosuccinate synthase